MTQQTTEEYFARCAAGFEAVLARELKGLGLRRVRPLKGGVAYFGFTRDAYRACLWSRVATRVQLVLCRVDAYDAEALYQGAASFAWEDHLRPGATIAVQAHGQNDALRNTQFIALKVKDALCDRMRDACGQRPDVNPKDPDFSVDVSVREGRATLYLNLSGVSLHRRGYRSQGVQTEAPLKETLAAGMLLAASWDEFSRSDVGAAFADPMCGSGTLAIEAALIAADIAPGILRTRWGFGGWSRHDKETWEHLVAEAHERRQEGLRNAGTRLMYAGDADGRALAIARENAGRAGVGELVRFAQADASELGIRLMTCSDHLPELGLVATNPPYGYRLQSQGELPQTYAALARGISALPQGWRMAAITPDAGLDTALGMRADRLIPCFNGPLQTTLRLYDHASACRNKTQVISLAGTTRTVLLAEANSVQFAARLRKVAKERAKWARKAGVGCYRIYDADLPDYAFSVDLYQTQDNGFDQLFIRVEEHDAPATVDQDLAARRLADARALIPAVLDVASDNLLVKPSRKEVQGAGSACVVHVREGALNLELNLSARHDTGLPLDLRPVRALLAQRASGARFLCLGSHAGVPTAFAAAGDAAATTTVDPSPSYLSWAGRNLQANGFEDAQHKFVQAELLAKIRADAQANKMYDLVFVDLSSLPAENCLKEVAQLLTPGGTIVLVSGKRDARLDYSQLEAAGLAITDITAQTIPHDFARTPKIHRCWLLEKRR